MDSFVWQFIFALVGLLFTIVNGLFLYTVKRFFSNYDRKHDELFNVVVSVDKRCQSIEREIYKEYATKNELDKIIKKIDTIEERIARIS